MTALEEIHALEQDWIRLLARGSVAERDRIHQQVRRLKTANGICLVLNCGRKGDGWCTKHQKQREQWA